MSTVSILVRDKGVERWIEAPLGASLMRVLKAEGFEGIEAACSGSMVCGTCHAYVMPAADAHLSAPMDGELALLDEAVERRPSSRLTCQIPITFDLDGTTVEVPASQV